MNNDTDLDNFIRQLVGEKQLPGLTDERYAEIIEELKGMLIEQINRAILDALPDSALDELNRRMDESNFTETEMQQIIANSGVDVAKITAETMIQFRAFYLGMK